MGSIDTGNILSGLDIASSIAEADDGLVSENPATGRAIACVRRDESGKIETVLAASRVAFRKWREVPAPRRGALVRALGEQLRRHRDLLGTLISLETGKIKAEGDGEVQEMIDIADLAVGLSRQLYGNTMHSERARHRMFEQWHPLGPVGVITAFNFPAAVWAWNAFIAAVCGDTIVWKPSPKAPLTALAIHRLACDVAQQHGAQDVFGLLISDEAGVGERLAGDPRLPLLSFTGSSAVGRKVATAVASRYGRSLLECSGNNAVIVDESADLDLAVRAIIFGAVGTAGQRCTSTRRLIVHESCYAELIDRLLAAYGQVCVGDPLAEGTLMGPLIDAPARAAFVAAVAEAEAGGGQVLCGGKSLEGPGYFVQPTLIAARNDLPVVQRETFGPILYVMQYRDFDQALAMQNAVPQGLSSALFTLNLRHAESFLSASGSDCGIANINLGTSGAEIGGAFGGEKETGGGREAGSDAWKTYMRRQTNTINWGSDLPLAQGIEFTLAGNRNDL
ncbi:MAG: aldehyde dehydrogenase family protein [Betaproteobacteria bacterium]|nr:aldehyde dehydrogenase family protein [Betaproteobacteria bacterium]